MDDQDKFFILASIAAPLILWWLIRGQKRYGTKGMR